MAGGGGGGEREREPPHENLRNLQISADARSEDKYKWNFYVKINFKIQTCLFI